MSISAFAVGTSADVATSLAAQLSSSDISLVVFFAHHLLDGALIGAALRDCAPGAHVIGCSGNGVFSDHGHHQHGAVAFAFSRDVAPRVGATLARLDGHGGVESAVASAGARIEAQLGQPLRELAPDSHVGLALLEGASGREEAVNEALGDLAPTLRFVGGSAGDDIQFAKTWAYCDGELAADGCAFALLRMNAPFTTLHACNFEATERVVTITSLDPGTRVVRTIDNEPAADFYARLANKRAEELAFDDLLYRPLGLMIDDQPWLRSPVRCVGDGVLFACRMLEGQQLSVMRPIALVDDLHARLRALDSELGGPPRGMILFNCALRMIEAQLTGVSEAVHEALSTAPHAGVHSNGESDLGHVNQTLTGLAWGASR
jgi:hypothetical protein